MGDIALHGPELIKMVALAKKRELNFAYCPGNDPKEDVFTLDLKKKPEILARVARGEGTGTKVSFGTATVKGKVMSLVCERVLPQLSKKLKKLLKFEKIAMNVEVFDLDGQLVEATSEDLNEDEETSSNDADGDEEERLQKLKARAAKLQAALRDVPSSAQAPLVQAFKAAVGALQGGDLDKADGQFSKLESAIAKLAGASRNTQAGTDRPALNNLMDASARLSQRIDDLGNSDSVDKLRAAHNVLEGQIASGDVQKAAGTTKALGAAIARLADQTQTASTGEHLGGETGPKATDADAFSNDTPISRARQDWMSTRGVLKSELAKLQAEILAVCQGDDFPNIVKESETLFSYLDAFDSRLEDTLGALVQEPDASRREKLRDEAQAVLSAYESELDAPFFLAVDGKNGFKSVNVRSAAKASLTLVNNALSAAA